MVRKSWSGQWSPLPFQAGCCFPGRVGVREWEWKIFFLFAIVSTLQTPISHLLSVVLLPSADRYTGM